MRNRLKPLAIAIRENFIEAYTTLAILIGLPLIAYVYVDWRLALLVAILTQISLGLLALRKSE